jgi:hypothetical protein
VARAASLPQDLASQALALSQAAPQLLQRPTSLQRQSSSFAETTADGEQAALLHNRFFSVVGLLDACQMSSLVSTADILTRRQ